MLESKNYVVKVLGPSSINLVNRSLNLSVSIKARSQRVLLLTAAQANYIKTVLRGQGLVDEFTESVAAPIKTVEAEVIPVAEAIPVTVDVVPAVEIPVTGETVVEAPISEIQKTVTMKALEAIVYIKTLITPEEKAEALAGETRVTIIEASKE